MCVCVCVFILLSLSLSHGCFDRYQGRPEDFQVGVALIYFARNRDDACIHWYRLVELKGVVLRILGVAPTVGEKTRI